MLFGKNNAWLTHNKAQKKTKQTLISTLKSVMRFWAMVVCWVLPLVAIGEVRFTHLLQESHQAGDGIGATTNIIQDQHGFIWIAGENGVLRYDGINTKHYIHSPSQISLSSNFTRNILEDHSGVIWVGTDFGIRGFG